ncbi:MatE family protein [Trichomonas vaginalis G3]|uniref:MatE family protein n=1 Tax=Trichomonas vaginalis (strain ATCC PRA-98 / G3) TaxID=412133 RepID=A2EIJ4_TRIV3|nr:multidrug resistance protein YPNP-related family [Trichomonas vaginalis G3]EAY07515.1 MatE family protein [Trichomonas vaginalis G3]KAI5550531.1 multidrug resistance protein YPNP-related family [Trichomonas vaginalis G3]|eukprot:XP_001319738.1 MatE family protein [Trichomonas vaginalis G3]
MKDNPSQDVEKISDEDKKEVNQGEEHKRLAGYRPLETIIRLCPGPLVSQIVSTLYGVVDSMWVSRFIGEIGMTALSVAFVIDASAISFAIAVSVSAATQIAYLLSMKEYDKINQVAADLFRICLIIGCCIPIILLPIAKPIFKFLEAPPEVVKLAFQYVIPLCAMNFFACCYYTMCGILQAEGRTWTYAISQISSMLLNMVCWDPLLLWSLKLIVGSSMATEIAMIIPGTVLITLMFCGKFAAKPKFHLFINKFAPETWMALKTGLSALIMNISFVVPTFVMQKYLVIRANKTGEFEMVIAVYNAIFRIYGLAFFVPLAMNAAYLPAASYAYGAKMKKRILHLTWHVIWISIVWGFLITFLTSVIPGPISSIFSKDPSFKKWSLRMIPICFYTYSFACVKFIMISFL